MAMKRGWIVFLVVLGVFLLMAGFFVAGIIAMFDTKPVVRDDTVLKLTLSGLITEKYPRDAVGREMEGARLQMHDIRKALAMAKQDERIEGVYLRVSNPDMGWAKALGIRRLIQDFKESGKFVMAFMETCDELAYYVALAADELYLQPHAYVEFNGFAAEVPFFKKLFNKIGMEPQVDNIGKYKSAGDILKRDSMSPAHREVTEALLDSYYDEFVTTVCAQRSLERGDLETALDRGLFNAEDVLKANLVDDLIYETAVTDLMKQKVHGEEATNGREHRLRMISAGRYAQVPEKEVGLGGGERVALIYAIGGIVSGESGYNPLMGRNMGSGTVVSMLRAARDNSAVKAVVLRVDSPGGSALASDVIWAEIAEVREKKPVVISMSDVAASGGYWISMGADAIVAEPLTITGSIGVVNAVFDVSGTYGKLGIVWETVKKGQHADMPTDKRPLTKEEWQMFQEQTYEIYEAFVQKVADGRDKTWDQVHDIAQGRIWTGNDALGIGLVDSLGGLEAAQAIAKQRAGIDSSAKTQWIVYPQPKGLLQSIVERFNMALARLLPASNTDWAVLRSLPEETRMALRQIALARQMRPGQALAIAPDLPVIR